MQDCKLNTRFAVRPELLLGKWALFLRRGLSPLPYEVVHVDRRGVTLVETWSWSTNAGASFTPPKRVHVPLLAFLDEYGGFSYLGPRSKFDWIRPGALAQAATYCQPHRRFGLIELQYGGVLIDFIPRDFREHIDGLNPDAEVTRQLRYTAPIWKLAKEYKPVRKGRASSIEDWETFFRLRHPQLVPPARTGDEPLAPPAPHPEAPKPEASVRGPSHWERIRTPPEDNP